MSSLGSFRVRPLASFATIRTLVAVAAFSGLGCAGAVCPGGVVEVPTRPPTPLPEEPQTPPAPNMTWIGGHWHYGPSPEPIWVWLPGHWMTAPEGKTYVPARTVEGDKTYRFHPGGFCR